MAGPTTPPIQLSGRDAGMLTGPSSAPGGAVTVNPGTNLNTVTAANAAGTTFYLTAGTHTLAASANAQIQTKPGNTYVGAPGAIIDGQGVNQACFGSISPGAGTTSNVTVRYLTIQNFAAGQNQAIVNQSAESGWLIEFCKIQKSRGVAFFFGVGGITRYCLITEIGEHGYGSYLPTLGAQGDCTLDHCEISYVNTDDWEIRIPGCGCSGAGKFWDASNCVVTNNWIHANFGVGLWADTNNVGHLYEGNYINDNEAPGLFYELSWNFMIRNNTFARNAIAQGRDFEAQPTDFPVGAIYISESGGDSRIAPATYAQSEITGNTFIDNYGGIVIYEGNGRYYNTPAGGVTYVPLGGVASLSVCKDPALGGTINAEPGYSDCRWLAKDIWIHDNDFIIDKARIGASGAARAGYNAVISDYGTFPAWSPYIGTRTATGNVSGSTLTLTSGSFNTLLDRWARVEASGLHTWTGISAVTSSTTATLTRPALSNGSGLTVQITRSYVIEFAMMHGRNIVFDDNRYVGDWGFLPYNSGVDTAFVDWKAAPYNQDAGSTLTP